jgi:metal-responsive CopG/Arc/MetJ family transcriptional regulator
MKVKTSITLSEGLLKTIRRAAKPGESRSRTIERLLRASTAATTRQAAAERDLALINRHADALNAEADDALAFQADV